MSAGYESIAVVRELDMCVRKNEILAVLGPNGAGKTTMLLTVAGFLGPLSGSIVVNGREMRGGSPRRMNQAGVVLVPDSRALFTELTPVENLRLGSCRAGPSVDDVLDLFPALRLRSRLKTADLSGGEQQMLALGRALVQAPKILLIDEMSMGLAPIVVESLMPLIRKVADESDAAVILVEQHIQLALDVADSVLVMVHGSVVESGPAADVGRDRARLESAYLGGA
jgi:branched-chain amino acid transport system ATP-binding protein